MKQLAEISRYYTEKINLHGASPQGVDWNSSESQRLRFEQLARVCEAEREFSLNDIGCGYGALYDHLRALGKRCDYLGVDISPAMIEKAQELHRGRRACRFQVGSRAGRAADYSIASGIFNVRLSMADGEWLAHVLETLQQIDADTRRGFAFNCLTKYSDAAVMKPYLFYADPCQLFDHCKARFSKNVALLHDYDLYEFTILVRKPS
jgi:SAM-dependent methyltransferase